MFYLRSIFLLFIKKINTTDCVLLFFMYIFVSRTSNYRFDFLTNNNTVNKKQQLNQFY